MIGIPFFYFTILLLFLYKKRGFDIIVYIVSLYALSSFFAILIDFNDLRPYELKRYNIGVFPTVLYCFLLTLTIWPFLKFKSYNIEWITLNKPKSFDIVVYFYLGCSLLVIASSVNDIIHVLNGDMGALRLAQARGESTLISSGVGGAFHSIFILAHSFGGYSMIMLLFYFYSICFLNKTKLFNSIILLSSMTVIAIGILGIDRSKSVYWLITYGFMLILFWRHMSSKQHKQIIKVTGIISFLVLSYFLMVTFSRFNDGDDASQNSMIWYAGQSFLYFSYFFDNVNYEVFSLQRIFPWFYNLFIENGINSTIELNVDIQNKTNTSVGVFSTFIGDIMVASGKFIAVAYCIIFYFISKKLLNFRNNLYVDFHHLIFLFCLITIPMLGVFTHFYASHSRTIPFLFFIGYGFYLRFKIKTN